jgi:caa(3)-type oxidase subunit IV
MAETIVRKKTYLLIWASLICLTVLVVMFFMHLRYEKQKVVWLALLAGMFWLSILFVLSMADYVTRGFLKVPGR